jgi:hypothetical protein
MAAPFRVVAADRRPDPNRSIWSLCQIAFFEPADRLLLHQLSHQQLAA